jgi:hypothetical protein
MFPRMSCTSWLLEDFKRLAMANIRKVGVASRGLTACAREAGGKPAVA